MLSTEYVVAQDFWLLNNIKHSVPPGGLHVFKVQCEVLASVPLFYFYCLKIKVKNNISFRDTIWSDEMSFTYSKF